MSDGFNVQHEAHRLAIETDDRALIVSAGAGSGKTQLLAERFVYLVTTGKAAVDQILTITYTRKAAREMRERIVHLLEQAGFREARWLVEGAYVSTIDSLCGRLIRENPLESQVDPFFEQLAEHEAERVFYRAFDQVVDQQSAQPDSPIGRLLREAFGRMRFGSDPRDALHTLRVDLYRALETIRLYGWSRENLLEWAQQIEQDPSSIGWQFLALVREALVPCLHASLKVISPQESLAFELRRVLQMLEQFAPDGSPEALLNTWRNGLMLRQGDSDLSHPVLAESVQRLREWRDLLQPRSLAEEIEHAWRTVAALHLLVAVWDEYQRLKRENNWCDFADTMSEAVRLLRAHPPVRTRYRQQFRFVMVDEFQDANSLQLELVRLLCNDTNLFVVGDAQQSIYAFRHADVSLFREMENHARSDSQMVLVELQRNFRSRPEILRFIEKIYRPLWSSSIGGDVFRPLHSAKPFAPKATSSVEFVVVPPATGEMLWRAIASATAQHIQQMVRKQAVRLSASTNEPVEYRHIAILLRQTSHVALFEEALSIAGIPFYNTARRQYYIQPEVRDLVFALTVVDSPTNDVALAAVLRSPMVGVSMDTLYACAQQAQRAGKHVPLWEGVRRWLSETSDEEAQTVGNFVQLVEQIQRQRGSQTVAQVLLALMRGTQYETRLLCRSDGKQRVANIRKLVQMALESGETSLAQFIERVSELERIALREGEAPLLEEMANVVRLYTIHSAKGLQFPVVYLPDVARPLRRRPQPRLLSCLPAQRFVAQGFQRKPSNNLFAQAAATWQRQHEWEEELRVWYVAMTRAIEHLVFVAPNGATGLWWNLFLDALQIPPRFERSGLVRLGEQDLLRVEVVDDIEVSTPSAQDEQPLKQVAEWLQGRSSCTVEEIMNWLDRVSTAPLGRASPPLPQ